MYTICDEWELNLQEAKTDLDTVRKEVISLLNDAPTNTKNLYIVEIIEIHTNDIAVPATKSVDIKSLDLKALDQEGGPTVPVTLEELINED